MVKQILLILIMFCVLDANEIKVVFSYSTPPYVFGEDRGVAISIVREALQYKSHTLKPVFISVGRRIEMFKHGYVDAIPIVKNDSGPGAYYSDFFIRHHSAAFALNSRCCDIKNVEDLKNYRVIAFQNAQKNLGQAFANVVKASSANYSEVANQKQQAYKLLENRVDAIVLDRHVFEFYKKELISQGKVDEGVKVDIFDLFEPTQYRLAFQDENVRNDFNEGLRAIKKSGRYDEIYDNYSKQYFRMKI